MSTPLNFETIGERFGTGPLAAWDRDIAEGADWTPLFHEVRGVLFAFDEACMEGPEGHRPGVECRCLGWAGTYWLARHGLAPVAPLDIHDAPIAKPTAWWNRGETTIDLERRVGGFYSVDRSVAPEALVGAMLKSTKK